MKFNILPEEIQGKCSLGGISSQGGFWDLGRHLQQGQQSKGVQGLEQGLRVPRKELGNKEGKQKCRAVTEPWTGAGKSSIILGKIGLPKEPLSESWQDLCSLWKSCPDYPGSWGWD